MGRSNRAKRFKRFRKDDEIPKELELDLTDGIEVQEVIEEPKTEEQPVAKIEDDVTDVVVTPKQTVVQKPSAPYNPNSANGLLNSILTTLLTQEYNRLHQQLLNIKQQLDAQKLITEPTKKEEPVALYSDAEYTEKNEAKDI